MSELLALFKSALDGASTELLFTRPGKAFLP